LAFESKTKQKVEVIEEQVGESPEKPRSKEELKRYQELLDNFREESRNLIESIEKGEIPDKFLDRLKNIIGQLPASGKDLAQEGLPSPPEELMPVQDIDFTILEEVNQDVEVLLDSLRSRDDIVKAKAVQGLLQKGNEAVEPIFNFILDEPSLKNRKLGALIINRLGPEAIESFVNLIKPTHEPERLINVIAVIPLFSNPNIVKKVRELNLVEDNRVQHAIFSVLKKLRGENIDKLILDLVHSKDEKLQLKAVRAIGEMRGAFAIPVLLDMVKKVHFWENEPNLRLQKEIMLTLGNIKDAGIVEGLICLIKKETPFKLKRNKKDLVRIAACWALGEIGSPKGREILRRCLHDKNILVRQVARGSLEKLSF
ncbi:HEAT repeat domain-containing protein, partial [bacterium]|nr:HEAT repeat domain-containing protein [bacterium]